MKGLAYLILLPIILLSCSKSKTQDHFPLPDYNTLILGRWTTYNTVYKITYNNEMIITDSFPSAVAYVTYQNNATKIWELQDGTKDTTNYSLAGNTIVTTRGTIVYRDTFSTLTGNRLTFYHKRPPGTMPLNVRFIEEWNNLIK